MNRACTWLPIQIGTDFPAADASVWTSAGAVEEPVDREKVPSLTAEELTDLADAFRKHAQAILRDEPDAAAAEHSLADTIKKIDLWAHTLRITVEVRPEQHSSVTDWGTRVRKWRFSSKRLLEAIQLSISMRGGAMSLSKTIEKCFRLTMPSFIVEPFISSMRETDALKKTNHMVGPSMIWNGQVALDAAISSYRRSIYSPTVLRWLWQDSSPIAGADWLMSKTRELEQSQLVATAQASIELARLTKSFKDSQIAANESGDSETDKYKFIGHEPEESWLFFF